MAKVALNLLIKKYININQGDAWLLNWVTGSDPKKSIQIFLKKQRLLNF